MKAISQLHVYETSGLGAGIHPDFPIVIRELTCLRDTCDPDARTHSRYDELYYAAYKSMYGRMM